MKTPLCPITGKPMNLLFTQKVLGKYDADFFHCPDSGIIQVAEPHWLSEAYESAITATDVGLATRNVNNRVNVSWMLAFLGLERGPYLDLGGGYGLFARLMRDEGFDFYTTDPFCENMFAKGYEPGDGFTAQAVTAFEVFEHVTDPLAFVQDAFSRYQCRTILFSTLTYGDTIPAADWWYWCFETGQHISFYNDRTLTVLAEKVGGHYFSLNRDFHVITEKPLTKYQQLVLRNRYVLRFYNKMTWKRRLRESLIISDYKAARTRLHAKQAKN
jgi:hypothetical protein